MTTPAFKGNGGAREDDVLVIGETTFRSDRRRFGLFAEDRGRHLYALGKTGSGKSTLLRNLVIQDLKAGRGVALFDPHGDLVESVLPHVPTEREREVLFFNPEDRDFPVAWNVFRQGRSLHQDPALLASSLVAAFKNNWSSSWGPRLEAALRAAILAIASDPRASLGFLYRFLTDEPLRLELVRQHTDPIVRQFWLREFPGYSQALRGEMLSPVMNKLAAVNANRIVRNIVAQERSRVDFGEHLEEGRILFAKLTPGTIGEDAAHLLGSLLLSSLELAAMSRPIGSVRVYVFIDEVQRYVSEALPSMLSEARKFGISLHLANQFFGQLTGAVQDAVLGNVGTFVIFRVGASDARILADELGPPYTPEDLVHLERQHVAVRLLMRGDELRPFSARTLEPPPTPHDAKERRARIVQYSREQYASPRVRVETAIDQLFDNGPS
ncbi:MAG: hypothetical protein JWO36_5735 [Myxococcales bacterium]|nr:hypothetical protein [Myxococcales bacterium]